MEDHGRRIICIVLRDNSFIIDDYSGRCTYSYGHNLVNTSVCCQFYGSSYSSASKITFFNNLMIIEEKSSKSTPFIFIFFIVL